MNDGPSGLDLLECWLSRSTRSCLGHQSRLVVPVPTTAWLNGHFASVVMAIPVCRSTWGAACRRCRHVLVESKSRAVLKTESSGMGTCVRCGLRMVASVADASACLGSPECIDGQFGKERKQAHEADSSWWRSHTIKSIDHLVNSNYSTISIVCCYG
ncbi:hypothetical protein XFF6166_920004 [Xanthomonas citri pv. fuscans]|nr:hypothetical protein XFF6166_920004 [Xanthomonas citri pv. fuscans]SOO03827.1 hypothetical protein XFF6960_890114 [Xanthomonas citri pv. fuscans]SOO05046.1 hypothetical protein XFF7767_340116 [Xanthomonas citri pv. fuscans]SOO12649.1 hypothetical protein XFF7766_1130004 [Xanthomonas citri pv. fuscans]SOO46224.1 hypothetical protein XFF1815_980115 [Xanthomonas citri pv. fuscans]